MRDAIVLAGVFVAGCGLAGALALTWGYSSCVGGLRSGLARLQR